MTRLQTLLLASTFLIFVSHLSSAYTYINLAASSAAKQGLLATDNVVSSSSHHHTRMSDRTIATLINIDLYLSTVLGLPTAIRASVAEKWLDGPIRHAVEGPSSPHTIPNDDQTTLRSFDVLRKNFDIIQLTASILRNFLEPTALPNHETLLNVGIDEAVLRNAGRKWASLSKDLGPPLSPSAATTIHSAAIPAVAKSEIEFALYWSQLSINMPFLHYLRPLADGHPIPDTASRPALMCLKIAVNVIVRCESLHQSLTESDAYSQFMQPGNWTCIYTLFLAVIALIFLISIHKGTSKPSEAWRKADSGIRILTALRCGDEGATRCLAVIQKLVRQLSYTVDFDFEHIEKTTRRVCEGQTKLPTLSNILGAPLSQTVWSSTDRGWPESHQHTLIESGPLAMSSADKMLAQAQSLLLKNDSMNLETEEPE